MTVLLRARTLIGLPVVTLGGDDIAEIKDVVFSVAAAKILGFTLNGRGFLSGPLKESLPWGAVHGLGLDAVMVRDADGLRAAEEVLAGASPVDRNVIGNRVLTDGGTDLGEVSDVVLAVGAGPEIVGFEIGGSENLRAREGRHLYIPLPDMISVSGEALVVPAVAADYIRDDLTGFGGAVDDFRARLRQRSP